MSVQSEAEYRDHIRATVERGDLLTGHTSAETAYVVADYPYGFRLRCSIRYWLEHKRGHGFRLVSQTTNPKKPGIVWNTPKPGTYTECAVMVRTEEGHVTTSALRPGGWSEWETLATFERAYAPALTDAHRDAIRFIRATIKAGDVLSYTVTADADAPRQTAEERDAIIGRALTHGHAAARDALISDAAEATEHYGEDDLEAYAAAQPPVVVTRSGLQTLLPGHAPPPTVKGVTTQRAMF